MNDLAAIGELARLALAQWDGLDAASLELITERENAVFRVDLDGAPAFALRVHRFGYHDDVQLRSQIEWSRALARDGVVRTAAVVDTRAAEPFAVVGHPGVSGARQVSLLEWEPGVALAELGGGGAAMLATLGRLMARLHVHASAWQPPPGFAVLRWDADGLVGDDPEWGRFWECAGLDAGDGAAMLAFRDVARAELAKWGEDPSRFGLVHGDFLPENVLVDSGRVTLLDFDDCGFGWFLFDIATALAIPSLRRTFPELRDAFVAGYREHRALTPDDLAALPLFLTLRAATYAGWVHTRSHTDFARRFGAGIVADAVRRVRDYLTTS